jgi:methyl-accepting chemotaxis protein
LACIDIAKFPLLQKQLETTNQSKLISEKNAKEFMESNTLLRGDIQILMQTLESKQQILDATRAATADKELQVKKLRDEALLSRKQLEDLASKEKELLEARDSAIEHTQRSEREHLTIRDAFGSMQLKYQKDIQQLQRDLEDLQKQFRQISAKSEQSMKILQNQMQQILDSRDTDMEEMSRLSSCLVKKNQAFAHKTTSQVDELRQEVSSYINQSENIADNVVGCRDEVNGLITRMRNFASQAN